MKLTKEKRQEIRKILKRESTTINDKGVIKSNPLWSGAIEEILNLGGSIFYDGSQMVISNW